MAKKSFAWFEKRRRMDVLNLAEEQIIKALDTVMLLHKAIKSISDENKEEAQASLQELLKEEEEVDNLRRSVFREMMNVALSSEFREDVVNLVNSLDAMADQIKDSARSVMVLLETNVPSELWDVNVRIAEALVESATALRVSIEELGEDPVKAQQLAKRVEQIESGIDRNYLDSKKLFIRYTREIDAGTLLILNDLVEFMEKASDICADTADYLALLASGE
jgi:predicted phosphate transport protein (TIGR00153 family)